MRHVFVVALIDECKFPLAVQPLCFDCANGWFRVCVAICFIAWWLFCLLLFFLYGFGVHPMSVFSVSVQVMVFVFVLSANPLFCVCFGSYVSSTSLGLSGIWVFIRLFLLLSLSRLVLCNEMNR